MAAPWTNTFYFLRVEIAKIIMQKDKFDIKHSTTLKSIMSWSKDRQLNYFLVVLYNKAPAQWSNIYATERWWHSKSYFIANKLKIKTINQAPLVINWKSVEHKMYYC